MKINLLLYDKTYEPDCLNICPAVMENQENVVFGNVINLDGLIDNASCSQILARDIIPYLDLKTAFQAISNWLSKLSHKGTLTIGATNMLAVCQDYLYSHINETQIQEILYGTPERPRKSCFNIHALVDEFKSKGYNVISQKMDGHKFSITIERP